MKTSKTLKPFLYIAIYYAIAMSVRYYVYIIRPDFIANMNTDIQSLVFGASPIIAGLIMVYVLKRKTDLRIFSIGIQKTIFVSLLPIILFSAVYYLNTRNFNITMLLTIGGGLLYAIFEEYGWRGYLQTELKDFKPIYKYLIVGVLWYFWHFETAININSLFSVVYIFAGSFGIGYVADKTKSLMLPSLFHMFYNVLFSSIENINFLQKTIIISISIIATIIVMKLFLKEKMSFEEKK